MGCSRRRLISVLGITATTGALAGCSGDGGGGSGGGGEGGTPTGDGDGGDGGGDTGTPTPDSGTPTPPPGDASPQDLLPAPPDGWSQGETIEQNVESTGAEAGYGGFYTDPEGGEYYVEILRWPSAGDAEAGWEGTYDGADSRWLAYVSRANFSFAGNGPDNEKVGGAAVTLLGNSPALTEAYVTENNVVE